MCPNHAHNGSDAYGNDFQNKENSGVLGRVRVPTKKDKNSSTKAS
jgi:hypothetical protein